MQLPIHIPEMLLLNSIVPFDEVNLTYILPRMGIFSLQQFMIAISIRHRRVQPKSGFVASILHGIWIRSLKI